MFSFVRNGQTAPPVAGGAGCQPRLPRGQVPQAVALPLQQLVLLPLWDCAIRIVSLGAVSGRAVHASLSSVQADVLPLAPVFPTVGYFGKWLFPFLLVRNMELGQVSA